MPRRRARWNARRRASPGQIPTILKINHANSLSRFKEGADQAMFGSVEDALRLGCSAIGFTIYPGSDAQYEQMEEIAEADPPRRGPPACRRCCGSYPRGGDISKDGETAMDVVGYGGPIWRRSLAPTSSR